MVAPHPRPVGGQTGPMRRPAVWLVSYALVCSVQVISQALELTGLAMATKPLLMPLLAAYLISAVQRPLTRLVRVVLAALAFSWLGDVLLEVARRVDSDLMFMAGIGGFLVAQVLYIVAFGRLVRASNPPRPPVWALVYVLYGVGLMVWLGPDLGEYRLPVAIYAAAICTMGIVASGVNRFTALGAAMFVASDSMIAVGKFRDDHLHDRAGAARPRCHDRRPATRPAVQLACLVYGVDLNPGHVPGTMGP